MPSGPEPTPTSRATLARIATEAAVSTSTVSKVLNGRTGVSEATRRRVEELLHEMGYHRSVAEETAPVIELVFSSIANEWAIEIIRGAERAARERGMIIALTQSGDTRAPSDDWLEGVLRRRPAGVIVVFSGLTPDQQRQLRTRDVPFVIVDPTGEPGPDVPSIGSANWYGGMIATRHLVQLGHTRIATITGPEDLIHSRARVAGYRSALDAAGIPIDESLILPGNYLREDGLKQGLALLSMRHAPTAVFAGSDMQAVGVYQAARLRNVHIPEQLAVVGYDDLEVASWVAPTLTTVRQPLTEMAEEATRLVVRLAQEGPQDNLRVDLATTLIERGSTAAIGSGAPAAE